MSDFADDASQITQSDLDRSLAVAKQAAEKMESGHPGYCDGCGGHFERVVQRGDGQYCGRCRDKYKLG